VPATNLASVIQGYFGQTPQGMSPAAAPAAPTATPAPQAQASTPGTHPETTRRARAIDIPGVPSLGVPGTSRRPRSMEENIRARRAEELLKPRDVAPGHKVTVGDETLVQGNPELRSVGAGGLYQVNPDGSGKQVVPGRAPTAPRPLVVNGRVLDPTDPTKVITTVPPQVNPNVEPPTDRGDRRAYEDFVKQWDQQQRTTLQGPPGADPDMIATGAVRRERAPYVAPPSQADWLAAGKPNVAQVQQFRADKAAGKNPTWPKTAPAANAATKPAPADGTRGTINGRAVEWRTIPGKGAGWVPVGQ
jgi:hypothetical protein